MDDLTRTYVAALSEELALRAQELSGDTDLSAYIIRAVRKQVRRDSEADPTAIREAVDDVRADIQAEVWLMVDDKRLEELADYYDDRDLSDEIGSAELERSPGDQVMVVTSIRVPKSLMDRIRDTATDEGLKPSALMRRWIELGLAQHESAPRQESPSLDHWSELMHRVVREELEQAGLR